jgi:hypothetical protein
VAIKQQAKVIMQPNLSSDEILCSRTNTFSIWTEANSINFNMSLADHPHPCHCAENNCFWPALEIAQPLLSIILLSLCYRTVPCCIYTHKSTYSLSLGQVLPYIFLEVGTYISNKLRRMNLYFLHCFALVTCPLLCLPQLLSISWHLFISVGLGGDLPDF